MVRMTTVWDRTADFLREYGKAWLTIAAGLILLPSLISGAFERGVATSPALMVPYVILTFIVMIVAILGGVAVTALAIRPGPAGAAIALAARRFLPVIGASLIVLIGMTLLGVPFIGLLVAGGVDFTAIGNAGPALSNLSSGSVAMILVYALAVVVLVLWLTARLIVLAPVIVMERNGLGAFKRSFALTRGHAPRIIGVMLLYFVVVGIATTAIGAAAGVLGFLAGGNQGVVAIVLVAFINALVSTATSVVQNAFIGKLYTQLAPGAELQETFE